MPIANYRPVKAVSYITPSGVSFPLPGILSMDLIESAPILVEATDGYPHVTNAVERARTTRILLRSRDLESLRAADRADSGGILTYTLIGLNGAADVAEQASTCYSRGVRATGTALQPYTCEIAFDCVTDQNYAIGTQG